MTEHTCKGPDAVKGWAPGKIKECPHHLTQGRAQPTFLSAKQKRDIDQGVGKVGTDRQDTHGYIDGGEGW